MIKKRYTFDMSAPRLGNEEPVEIPFLSLRFNMLPTGASLQFWFQDDGQDGAETVKAPRIYRRCYLGERRQIGKINMSWSATPGTLELIGSDEVEASELNPF